MCGIIYNVLYMSLEFKIEEYKSVIYLVWHSIT